MKSQFSTNQEKFYPHEYFFYKPSHCLLVERAVRLLEQNVLNFSLLLLQSYKSKGSRFFSVSTEDASSAPDQQSHFEFKLPLVKQTSKQPWSAFFGANKVRIFTLTKIAPCTDMNFPPLSFLQQEAKYMDMLVDQLNIFSRFGSVEKSSSVPSSMSSSSCDHTHESKC